MMKHHSSRLVAFGTTLIALIGCTTVPAEQVEVYAAAFDQANAAGSRLYDEVSGVITRTQSEADAGAEAELAADQQPAQGLTAIRPAAGPFDDDVQIAAIDAVCPKPSFPPEPYRTCFVPSDFVPGGLPGEPNSLAARRRALQTITTFNTIALRLASGETAQALGVEVQRLGTSASSLAAITGAGAGAVPLIGVSAGLAERLAHWAESLRADQELRAALAAGSPLIQQLLAALVDDTRLMYAFKREEIAEQLDDLKADAQRASVDLKEIIGRHAAFPTLTSMDRRYASARGRISGLPFESLNALAGSRGDATLDARSADRAEEVLARLESIAADYANRLTDLDHYYDALGEYVSMLHHADEALQIVATSARAPQSITVSAASLRTKAAEVSAQAREIERLLET